MGWSHPCVWTVQGVNLTGFTELTGGLGRPVWLEAPVWCESLGVVPMSLLFSNLIRLWEDEQGADLVEYGLLAAMIAAAGVAVFPVIGDKLEAAFETWGNNVYQAWEPENPLPPPEP